MQTSQVHDPPALGFINLAKRSSTGAAGVTGAGGSGGLEAAISSFSFSFSCSFWFSHFTSHFWLASSFLASVFPDPNVNPENSAGFESVPFVWGLARKLKASATATLLVEENPPKLEKMFFFWSSFRFLLLAFLMTRP